MGSIDDNSSGGSYGYRMSKVALNMAGKSLAIDLNPRGIAVAILHPGLVRTRMVGFNPQAIPPEEAVRGCWRGSMPSPWTPPARFGMPMGRCCRGRAACLGTDLGRGDFSHAVPIVWMVLLPGAGPTTAVTGSLGIRSIRGGLGDQAGAPGAAGGTGNGIGHTIGGINWNGRRTEGEEQRAGEGEAEGKGETEHLMRISDPPTAPIVTVS